MQDHPADEMDSDITDIWVVLQEWIYVLLGVLEVNPHIAGLHPVNRGQSEEGSLQDVVWSFPSAPVRVRPDASDICESEVRHQEREDQRGSFHTHIIPQETNSRKKRTDVQGCIVPHRREVC